MTVTSGSPADPVAPGGPPAALVSYLEGLPEPHILFDDHYRIAAANAAYRARFSPQRSVVGRTCHAVSHGIDLPCDQAGESCPLARARRSGRRERVLHLHHTPHGESYVQIELVPVRDGTGGPAWYVERMEPLAVAAAAPGAADLIGRSAAFQHLLGLVARVGPSTAAVLLLGESGTGKELVARAVHDASARCAHPLVVVDCASLPESLFESELFGHEKGAFTGAHAARPGLVDAARGGTLFLDEVGDIPLAMQVKLLRLLENGTFRRVGSTELRHADVRLVSATHRDLGAMVREGRFRQDLLHRLAIFPLRLPPLRERTDDIAPLAVALLDRVAPSRRLQLSPDALARLVRHPFPGNVRELRNVLERVALLADAAVVSPATVEEALALGALATGAATLPASAPTCGDASRTADPGPAARRRAAGREALRRALAVHRGPREDLAHVLGISVRTLYRRLAELDADTDAGPPRG